MEKNVLVFLYMEARSFFQIFCGFNKNFIYQKNVL